MLRELLRTGFVLDGAMGTQLIERGLTQGQTSALWNVERPEDVLAVHQAYADTGAQAITANTFGANRFMLSRHGLADRLREINKSAVALAKRTGLPVLGDIGPGGEFLEPFGDLEEDELAEAVNEQAEALIEAGVDGFLVETFSAGDEMAMTIRILRESSLPVLATFTYEERRSGERRSGFQTMMGLDPSQAVAVCLNEGADAVGANCGTSLSLADYLVLADELLHAAGETPVILQPNAGAPKETDGGFVYDVTPDAYADFGATARAKGIRILGGCCGTTPAHISALSSGFTPHAS